MASNSGISTDLVYKSIGPMSIDVPGVFALMFRASSGRSYLLERASPGEAGSHSFVVHEIGSDPEKRSFLRTYGEPLTQGLDILAHLRDGYADNDCYRRHVAQIEEPSSSLSPAAQQPHDCLAWEFYNLDGPTAIFTAAQLRSIQVPSPVIYLMVKDILLGLVHMLDAGVSHGRMKRLTSVRAAQPGRGAMPTFLVDDFSLARRLEPHDDEDAVARGELRAVHDLLGSIAHIHSRPDWDRWLPLDAIQRAMREIVKIDELEWARLGGLDPATKLSLIAGRFGTFATEAMADINTDPVAAEKAGEFIAMLDSMAEDAARLRPSVYMTLQEALNEAAWHGPRWMAVLVDPNTFQLLFTDDAA